MVFNYVHLTDDRHTPVARFDLISNAVGRNKVNRLCQMHHMRYRKRRFDGCKMRCEIENYGGYRIISVYDLINLLDTHKPCQSRPVRRSLPRGCAWYADTRLAWLHCIRLCLRWRPHERPCTQSPSGPAGRYYQYLRIECWYIIKPSWRHHNRFCHHKCENMYGISERCVWNSFNQ